MTYLSVVIIAGLMLVICYLVNLTTQRSKKINIWISAVNHCDCESVSKDRFIEILGKIDRDQLPENPVDPDKCVDICGMDDDGN